MRSIGILLGAVFLAACGNTADEQGNSPGLRVTAGQCESRLAKSADRKEGELRYISQDSIGITFNATLNCEAEYSYKAKLLDQATLDLVVVDIGNYRSKCVCAKNLSLDLKSVSGEDYASVRTLVFHTDTINLAFP